MQGFRTYNEPMKMLHLHSVSIKGTECESDVNAIINNKAD